jgi:NADPH-dependent 2,4-dienoyl-CoA reductase/sulfur reductase-like enzyme
VIGGGYIGLEMVEALHARGLAVTVVELLPHLMANFDADMVNEVTEHVRAHGVEIALNTKVSAVTTHTDALVAQLDAGVATDAAPPPITTDLIVVATGVRPNRALAEAAGLRIGATGAIWVDDQMRTSDPDIFAAGDCVEHVHLVLGQHAWIPLATSANKGGRIAGINMAGGTASFPGILGTAVVKAFDYTMAITGITEASAKQSDQFGDHGRFVGATIITEPDKAGYWPGVEELRVKLVYDRRNGRLLGGQLVGKEGVNKRIDILATALHAGMTVHDLGWLDLSYAPPYSPTWDPVQVAANVAAKAVTAAANPA